MSKLVSVFVVAGVLAAPSLAAQDYRLRVDTRLQSVAYRGWTLDSVPASSVVADATGRRTSPGGIAVDCLAGATYCTFFSPGPTRSSVPVVGAADLSVWGFGVEGLRLHTKLRALGDLESGNPWPGTKPAVQLLEGYAEYVVPSVTVEAGRTHVTTRFGFRGFDGGRVELRPFGRTLRVSAYGGWALARGFDVPITSPVLNPLADYQLTKRQPVVGGWLAWWQPTFSARVGYQREYDPGPSATTLERAAFDGHLAVSRQVSVGGGADYDLAAGTLGSADAVLTLLHPNGKIRATVGGRRYRPYFDLWSIWSVFSPIAYSAASASAAVSPVRGFELRARGEAYQFDDPGAQTALVTVENDGWRWSVGAHMTRVERWTFGATAHQEHGPGAASLGWEGQATFDPSELLGLTAHVARMRRPLEYRFDDSKVWSYGLRTDVRVTSSDTRLYAEVSRYDETRERGDAAQLSWNQLRVNVGAMLTLGSGAESRPLHPAILRIPDARRPQ